MKTKPLKVRKVFAYRKVGDIRNTCCLLYVKYVTGNEFIVVWVIWAFDTAGLHVFMYFGFRSGI